jgi:DNA sulfur modification protein DndB
MPPATTTIPAIRGVIGKTVYYQANIPARDLVAIAIPASEMSNWGNSTMSEKIQREVSLSRVKEELMPYLAYSRDRFYGSLIITVMEPDHFEFEALSDVVPKMPAAYESSAQAVGFLTIAGGDLVALDGQHRLVGLRELITNPGSYAGDAVQEIGNDNVCVMFIRHESLESTRRIFNKVNRHARPTTPTDNIVTSEDDGYALVTRWLTEQDPPSGMRNPPLPPLNWVDKNGDDIYEWTKHNLTATSPKLTTLHTVYQTVIAILSANGVTKFSEKQLINRPDLADLRQAYRWSADWWNAVLEGLTAFRWIRTNPEDIPAMRQRAKKHSLLLRPAAQIALFRGLGLTFQLGRDLEDAIKSCNKIPWSMSNILWRNILVSESHRMLTRQHNFSLGGRVIAYHLAAHLMDADSRYLLQRDIATENGWLEESGTVPRALPSPRALPEGVPWPPAD